MYKKKLLKILAIYISVLLVCGVIGRITHPKSTGADEKLSGLWNGFEVEFVDSTTSDENPWGYTSCFIDYDGEECLYFNPGTTIVLSDVADAYVSQFEIGIHESVAELSNGAAVIFEYYDVDDKLISQEKHSFGNSDTWSKYDLESKLTSEVESVHLVCESGDGGDSTGDWVVIKAELFQ